MGLIALGCEQCYMLKVADVVRFFVLRNNSKNGGTYYAVGRTDHSIISHLPGRDNKWGTNFFSFSC